MKRIVLRGHRLVITADDEEMSRFAAETILERLTKKPDLRLLVPTGTTPIGTYLILRNEYPDRFQEAVFFNMDEYCSQSAGNWELVPESDPVSYRSYMNQHLFTRLRPKASYFPDTKNITHEGLYDRLIEETGGIDLCLNALGEDGHTFGFNFPGTSFDSQTRLVQIAAETRSVNRTLTGMETPAHAVTVGLGTGMQSREVLFLVSGERKAEILARVLHGPEPTTSLPASLLKRHPRCLWLVDEAAASCL